MALFTVSAFAFLIATALLHREPWGQVPLAYVHARHITYALSLQTAAVIGLFVSVLAWIAVAISRISSTVQQRRLAQGRNRA